MALQARTGRQEGGKPVNDCSEQAALIDAKNRDERVLLGTLFCLSVADGILTRFIVSEGLGSEGNPWLRNLPHPIAWWQSKHWVPF